MPERSRQPDPGTNVLLEAALEYAERGLHVLPLEGKAPRLSNGWHGASTDAPQIRRWWKKWPDANVGIACAPSGLLVVDIDQGEEKSGEATFRALVASHGELPATVESHTGGGGRHLLFSAGENLDPPGALGPNVDLRHRHYIVAPPSVHPDTAAQYEWADGAAPRQRDLAPAPTEWIAAATTRDREGPAFRPTADDWAVPPGERHDAFVSIAGTLRHSLAATPDEIEAYLQAVSPRFGDAPNRDEHIRQVARSMEAYPPGRVPWEYRFGRKERDARPSRLELLSLEDARTAAEEEVDWVVPDLLAAGEKAVIAGPPKSLKTWLALHLLRCVVVGGAVLGEEAWKVERTAPVLFVQEEGSKQRWARRVAATFEGTTDLPFFYTHRGGFSLLRDDHVDWVIENAQRVGARLIVVDPWQRVTPGVKENDASATGPAWDAIHRIATETGAAVVVLHHANKGSGDPSMDSIRGSSRMAGEVDLIVVVRKNERGRLEVYLDGRDLVRDDEGGNLEVEYETDHPDRMRAMGFRLNVKGTKNGTREAVIEVLQRAEKEMTSSEVRGAVAEHLDEKRTRQSVGGELQKLAASGEVVENASGKGKSSSWRWVHA